MSEESAEEPLISVRGWLRQKMPAFRFDRQVYCVVNDTDFIIYKDESMDSIERSIHLADIVSVTCLPASSRPGFVLLLNKNSESISFMSTSIHTTQKWICALQIEPIQELVNINSFELLHVIGQGASGKVMLAQRKSTGEYVAIKVIRKDNFSSQQKETRVRAERNALMRAKHQFITRLYFAFQTPQKLYFVMEYAPGGDLKHHIDSGVVFSRYQIQLYLAELVIALRTVHSLGIIYRDLKPENILLDNDGHIKLADFGLARELDPTTVATSLCGTCEYIAPEMLKHEPQTFTCDWWSFGVIAYQLLCRRLPFASANRNRLFELITSAPLRIPPSLDQAASSFIRELLEKDPAKRLGAIGTDICSHPFFENISWSDVEMKRTQPDFVPSTATPESVENFDEYLTSIPPTDSFVDMGSFRCSISGFSYVETDMCAFSPEADELLG